MTAARRPSWRVKLLAVFLSPIVVFGLLELGLRIGGYRHEPERELLEGRTDDELQRTALYVPHPDLIWALRPSALLDLEEAGFVGVETNAYGLRGEEPPPPGPRAPGELRILCLGDSITFGLGLRAGETWPDRMAEALRAAPALQGRRIRTVNAATPGYSSLQGMRQFERFRDLDFDVVVFYFGMNDSRPMRGLPDRQLRLPSEGMTGLLAGVRKLRLYQLARRAVTGLNRSSSEGTRVGRDEFRDHVRSLIEIQERGGPQIVFVREPECCDLTIAQMERVVARAEEEGVDSLVGPRVLFSWIGPAPEGADLVGIRITRKSRPALRFRPNPSIPGYARADTHVSLDQVRADLALIRGLKRALDGLLEELPEGSLGYEDLFGSAPPGRIFVDNCHLSREGAELAGRAIAEEVLRRLR